MPVKHKKALTPTQKVILSMLTENTGAHMLDSGGAYGRNWERNQTKAKLGWNPFEGPAITMTASKYGIELSHSVAQFLDNALVYDRKLDRQFHNYANRSGHKNASWAECISEFCEDRGFNPSGGGNSYNGDSILSQVIQWDEAESDEDGLVIFLQIHNGCDVRGGYTAPHVFRVCGDRDGFYLDDGDVNFSCNGPVAHGWYSDDGGYHMSSGHYDWPRGDIIELEDGEPIPAEYVVNPDLFKPEDTTNILKPYKYHGKLVCYDGKLFCPTCGHEMKAWANYE